VPARRGAQAVPGDLRVVVGVHVDEPGRDDEPADVERPASRRLDAAEGDDPALVDRHVGVVRRGTGAVAHPAAAQDEVDHAAHPCESKALMPAA